MRPYNIHINWQLYWQPRDRISGHILTVYCILVSYKATNLSVYKTTERVVTTNCISLTSECENLNVYLLFNQNVESEFIRMFGTAYLVACNNFTLWEILILFFYCLRGRTATMTTTATQGPGFDFLAETNIQILAWPTYISLVI